MTLKELRQSCGMTQCEMAARLSISRVTFTRYENGTRKPPTELANRIAKEFNLSIEEIWTMLYERSA